MFEVATIVIGIILAVVSIGGWIYTIRKNGRREGMLQQQVDSLVNAVNRLPCQIDSDYLQGIGALTEAVKNQNEWLKTVEGEQKALNKRIDGIVNSRAKRSKG